MRVVVIGGSGHIGSYLVPRLVADEHEVIHLSRGAARPYVPHAAWDQVRQVNVDREAAEREGRFGARVADLEPDVVIDNLCFTLASAEQLVAALRGRVRHFLHTGTMWVHGYTTVVPTPETAPRHPFCEYGIQKAAIEAYLLDEAQRRGFPATILHPGHVVGIGHAPLNPAGNFNLDVFRALKAGEPLTLPNLGLETVHHVHGDDVAAAFMGALANRAVTLGESFHVVSATALTLRGYAEASAAHFGQAARLDFLPWERWRETVSSEDAAATWDHIAHSPHGSIAKVQRLLGYQPRYTSLEAVFEALDWLAAAGKI